MVGLFICASLKEQFEFLLAEWAHDGLFAPGLGRTQDPFLGAGGTLRLPVPGGHTELTDLPRLVTTRGGAYVFLPSVTVYRVVQSQMRSGDVEERLDILSVARRGEFAA